MKSKSIISLLLALILCCSLASPALAAEESNSGTLRILNYNVDGLPVPSWLSGSGRDPLADSKLIPGRMKEYSPDIIAVQEDFNFHQTIKNGIGAKYTTIHSGGVPFGDGLNVYSKFPIYNVNRQPWKDAYGIFDNGSDELTPKGFICTSIEIQDGVFIDFYDMHADAFGAEPNIKARLKQYKQILDFADTYSKDHAVIITGDVNTYFSSLDNKLAEMFIDGAGFKEAWVEVCNDGEYDTRSVDPGKFNPYYDPSRPGVDWRWGKFDSAEKMFYRDGGGVSLEAIEHQYVCLTDDTGRTLSDHNAQFVVFNYTIDRDSIHDTRTYKKEFYNPFKKIFNTVKYFFKALSLVLGEVPKLISGEIKIIITK